MDTDTAGNFTIIYDECACCELDTGGNHQLSCPLYGEYRYPLYRTYYKEE